MALAAAILAPGATALPTITGLGMPSNVNTGEEIIVSVAVASDYEVIDARITYSNPDTGESAVLMPMNLTQGDGFNGTWNYTIPAQPWKGSLQWTLFIKDGAGYSVTRTGSINVLGEERPRPFPWTLVFIIGFLGVVMVLTELIFKPGLYRKTGRQKAKELEEQDRLEESERTGRDGKRD